MHDLCLNFLIRPEENLPTLEEYSNDTQAQNQTSLSSCSQVAMRGRPKLIFDQSPDVTACVDHQDVLI